MKVSSSVVPCVHNFLCHILCCGILCTAIILKRNLWGYSTYVVLVHVKHVTNEVVQFDWMMPVFVCNAYEKDVFSI